MNLTSSGSTVYVPKTTVEAIVILMMILGFLAVTFVGLYGWILGKSMEGWQTVMMIYGVSLTSILTAYGLWKQSQTQTSS